MNVSLAKTQISIGGVERVKDKRKRGGKDSSGTRRGNNVDVRTEEVIPALWRKLQPSTASQQELFFGLSRALTHHLRTEAVS